MNNHNALENMHEKLLEALRHREQEIFQYLAILVPALGGFVWLIYKDVGIFLFSAGSIGIMLLLLLGAVYSLSLGYNYRYITLQLAKIEVQLGIKDSMLVQWPKNPEAFLKNYNLYGHPWCTPPEIIKVFWQAFLVGIIFVFIAASLKVTMFSYTPNCYAFALILIISTMCVFLGWIRFPKHFGHKLKLLCEDDRDNGKWEILCQIKTVCKENRSQKLYSEIFEG